KGRGDFVSIFVLELAPGAKSAPQKHLFEEVVYVLSGHGNTTIETSDGRRHSFEWGPKSLFALPLNARYQHFNSSGRERARLASHRPTTSRLCSTSSTTKPSCSTTVTTFRSARERPNISAARASSFRCGRAATCGRPISSPTSPASNSRPGSNAAPADRT